MVGFRLSKLVHTLVPLVVVSLLAATGASAQDPASPDLGSGWELRSEQSMEVWSTVAGSADVGFSVRGWEGDGATAEPIALWSPDGVDWQEVTDPTVAEPVIDMAANDSGFVAVRGNRLPNDSVLFSADGQTWEPVSVGARADFWRVESGPEGFLLVSGCDFVVRFSTDGRDWTPSDIPDECGTFRAAQTDEGWVAVVSRANAVLSSNDGVNWDDVDAQPPLPQVPPATSWLGFADALRNVSLSSDGETLVLAGEGIGGGLWVSTDGGVTWTDESTTFGEVEMAVSDFGFVGVAPQRVLFSADGDSWVEHRVDVAFHDVAAVGDTVVATATDGVYTWSLRDELPNTGAGTGTLVAIALMLIVGGAIVSILGHRSTRHDELV